MEKDYYNPFEIVKLEKISDDVTHIGRNYVIKINATLGRTNNEKRYVFYKEYEYTIGKYIRTSIKRGFDYYLSIESINKPADGEKVFLRIGVTEYYGFMEAIKDVMGWFTDKRWSNTFAKKDGKLIITSDRPPTRTIYGLPMNKYISFDVTIVDGFVPQPGVRITLGDESIYTDVSADVIFGIYGALVNYNMFMSAQIMVSSLGIPLGTNRVNLHDNTRSNALPSDPPMVDVPKVSTIEGRRIGQPRIEDLEGDD